MHFVHPSDPEKFALRLLLLYRKGMKSFDDLKTIDGTLYQTFQEAGTRLGISDSNSEACSTITNDKQLRELFALVLLHCQPSNPVELWN
jgi:hypothetical protein